MEQIYEIREILISYYKKYELYISFIAKFLIGVTIFAMISSIGYASDIFSAITDSALKLPYLLLMGVLFAVLPLNVNYGFIILNITIQFSSKIEVAAIICMALLLVFFFYARIGGKESTLVLAVFFAYLFKVPSVIPLFAGLYMGLTSIIPISVGVLLFNLVPLAMVLGETAETAGTSIMDMPATFTQIYLNFSESLKNSNEWAVTAFVFAMVVIVVYVVSKLQIDYAKEISIVMGVLVNVICLILAVFFTDIDISIFSLLFSSIMSGLIVFVIQFFDIVLNYQRAEKVEFEDEENYYYVKVIPKIMIHKKSRTVKRIKQSPNKERSNRKRTPVYNDYDKEDEDQEYNDYENYLHRNIDYDDDY